MSERDKHAIVAEGGGMRGVFSAGVLDAFLDAGFDPFDDYLGVSAGACNLSSHVAGQHGRNLRIYTGIMCRPWLFSLPRFLRGGSYMDLDGLWQAFAREDPLDAAAAIAATRGRGRGLVIVCTAVASGAPRRLEPEAHELNDVLRCSSAIPVMCRPPPEHRGEGLVDGGIADPLPVRAAIDRGARRVLVLRSRPASYVKRDRLEPLLLYLGLRAHPALRRAAVARGRAYRAALELIASPPVGIGVDQIAPPAALRSSRTTQDPAVLRADYELGVDVARAFLASPAAAAYR